MWVGNYLFACEMRRKFDEHKRRNIYVMHLLSFMEITSALKSFIKCTNIFDVKVNGKAKLVVSLFDTSI